jgi:hypothetical protein
VAVGDSGGGRRGPPRGVGGGGVGAWLTSRTAAATVPAAATAGACAGVPVADAVLPSVVTISVQGLPRPDLAVLSVSSR